LGAGRGGYRASGVLGWVLPFYLLLRSIVRAKLPWRLCLARCRHCRIFFLTARSNRGRHDLSCPFGCREAHRKEQSHQRSQAYYQTDNGREKKRQLNRRRSLLSARAAAPKKTSEATTGPPPPIPPALARHIRLVVSCLEGRWLTEKELEDLIAKIVRQHRLGRPRRIDYAVARLNKGPPESTA
jgi:hypothetical protein